MSGMKTKVVVATEERVCKLCGKKIAIGDKYEQQLYRHEGKDYQFDCHRECVEVAWDYDLIEYLDIVNVDQKQFTGLLNEYRNVNGPYNQK